MDEESTGLFDEVDEVSQSPYNDDITQHVQNEESTGLFDMDVETIDSEEQTQNLNDESKGDGPVTEAVIPQDNRQTVSEPHINATKAPFRPSIYNTYSTPLPSLPCTTFSGITYRIRRNTRKRPDFDVSLD